MPYVKSHFSAVLHESHLFSDTIKYNITLETDDKKIDFDRLKRAISLSLLIKLINNQPYNIDTKIGKGGKVLSRGQKQKIIIARSLYKNANYIIFDEFTNFLDNISKEKILTNIYREYKEKTIISVSHKVNDLRFSDYIYYMEDGTIIEQGTQKELLSLKKNFFNLYSLENGKE